MLQTENFHRHIVELIQQVPQGKVTTYGDLAAMAGSPASARIVGGIAHFEDDSLPWHRLVNRFGGLASGFHGGRDAQAELLLREGVTCSNYIVNNFEEIRWQPNH